MTKYNILLGLITAFLLVAVFVVLEIVFIINNGSEVPAPRIPRGAQSLGIGTPLTYVVMGDSTSIGQGADYPHSFAFVSAQHLAKNHRVSFVNVGVSGATVKSVGTEQLNQAMSYKPQIVLLAVGGNDSTHFTLGSSIKKSLQLIIDGLKMSNPDVKIVVTRSPAVDSVSRFPFGAKHIIRLRSDQVNRAFQPIIDKNKLIIAPVAEKTRNAFLADPTLTALDNFHPNARGYALWYPIINKALDSAVNQLE